MIPKQTIDEIFQTARVEEVIGDFLHLKKAGSNLKAKSPFVDEKTPSFMVSPSKQIWKCFSSGKGGNVVSFLMEHEHYSYVEALTWLANKYNIEIKEDHEKTPEEKAAYTLRENLSIINEFARDYFVHNLHNNEQGKAIGLSYFLERGFREDIIKKFQLGYCLDESDAFTKAALEKNYKLEYLIEAGLTKKKDERTFDFFRGRVMFPIHSVAGKVLGFGGRTLRSDKKTAKYFNSPESELYNKSRILYGLYFAKNAIIKYDRCFLVEGYTDVISLHQSGIENVVASSGTALTEDQVKLIKRYSENITILYDGDPAGIKASFRGIDLILEQGMNVKVVLFPEGEDPDSFAKKSTATELEEYIEEHSKDFIVFKSDVLLKEAGGDPVQKASLIRDIIQSIAKIPDAITRQVYTRECASMFGMEEQILVTEITKLRRNVIAKKHGAPEIKSLEVPTEQVEQSDHQQREKRTDENIYSHELDLVRIMLNYGVFQVKTQHVELDEDENEVITEVEVAVSELIVHEIDKDELELENPLFRKIFDEIKEGIDLGELRGEKYFVQYADPEIARTAVDIISNRYELSPKWTDKKVYTNTEVDNLELAVKQSIYSYKTARIKREKEVIQTEIKKLSEGSYESNYDEIMTLMARQKQLDKVINLLTNNDSLGRVIH
ncbi:MAG: DNA primase [Crocinitomicaceae bacterium]|nr:DNA primase [Crocinitomicaceae bacterium]